MFWHKFHDIGQCKTVIMWIMIFLLKQNSVFSVSIIDRLFTIDLRFFGRYHFHSWYQQSVSYRTYSIDHKLNNLALFYLKYCIFQKRRAMLS